MHATETSNTQNIKNTNYVTPNTIYVTITTILLGQIMPTLISIINQERTWQRKNKMSYLMARLSFSNVIFGFSFRFPHNLATFSGRTNLNIPSSWFSQQIRLGQYSWSRSKSLINSHSLPVFFSVQIKNHISSTAPLSGSDRFVHSHSQWELHPFGPWILNSAFQCRYICFVCTGSNCIPVTPILSIHVQFLNKDIDLFDADKQDYHMYSLCHVQPLISGQEKQQYTYIYIYI